MPLFAGLRPRPPRRRSAPAVVRLQPPPPPLRATCRVLKLRVSLLQVETAPASALQPAVLSMSVTGSHINSGGMVTAEVLVHALLQASFSPVSRRFLGHLSNPAPCVPRAASAPSAAHAAYASPQRIYRPRSHPPAQP